MPRSLVLQLAAVASSKASLGLTCSGFSSCLFAVSFSQLWCFLHRSLPGFSAAQAGKPLLKLPSDLSALRVSSPDCLVREEVSQASPEPRAAGPASLGGAAKCSSALSRFRTELCFEAGRCQEAVLEAGEGVAGKPRPRVLRPEQRSSGSRCSCAAFFGPEARAQVIASPGSWASAQAETPGRVSAYHVLADRAV